MKWEKLGQIFDLKKDNFRHLPFEFAKSPQAFVLQDRVRIYFSGQVKSENGKYLSLPFYLDFDMENLKIIEVSETPVMTLGKVGCFDEHGIFPFHLFQDENQILAFTTGWSRRTSVSIDMGIGLARSFDTGISFQRFGDGPVMTAHQNERFLVGDAFVRKFGSEYCMWYIFGSDWVKGNDGQIERVYRIAHARSKDCVEWKRDGKYIIEPVLNNECQALPTIFHGVNGFHMYFCFRDVFDFRSNRENAYRLGYAFSSDGELWNRCDDRAGIARSDFDWDSQMMCYPNVFSYKNEFYMLYNGDQFGRYGFGLARLVSED